MLIDFNKIIKYKHSNNIQIQKSLLNQSKTKDYVLRLFSVNTNLCGHIYRFNDLPLKNRQDKDLNIAQLMVKDVRDLLNNKNYDFYNTNILLNKYEMSRLSITNGDIVVVKGKKGKTIN